jgi:hypothetical protein
MDCILIRGGDKTAPIVAKQANWHYGTRHDYKPYDAPFMIDIRWDKYDWSQYLKILEKHNPQLATVADYETPEQKELMLSQVSDIQALGITPLCCPKWDDAILDIPPDVRIAISVKTSYAGYIPPDLSQLYKREIHLLGGNPHAQSDLIVKLNGVGAVVASMDMNYHIMKAQRGQFFSDGLWVQANNKRTKIDMAVDSCIAIKQYLHNALNNVQRGLI